MEVWPVGVLVVSSAGRFMVIALSEIVPGSGRSLGGWRPGCRKFLVEDAMEKGNESVKAHQVVSKCQNEKIPKLNKIEINQIK